MQNQTKTDRATELEDLWVALIQASSCGDMADVLEAQKRAELRTRRHAFWMELRGEHYNSLKTTEVELRTLDDIEDAAIALLEMSPSLRSDVETMHAFREVALTIFARVREANPSVLRRLDRARCDIDSSDNDGAETESAVAS